MSKVYPARAKACKKKYLCETNKEFPITKEYIKVYRGLRKEHKDESEILDLFPYRDDGIKWEMGIPQEAMSSVEFNKLQNFYPYYYKSAWDHAVTVLITRTYGLKKELLREDCNGWKAGFDKKARGCLGQVKDVSVFIVLTELLLGRKAAEEILNIYREEEKSGKGSISIAASVRSKMFGND